MDPSSCIKTLSSSGLTTNGAVVVATSTTGGRSLAPLPPGETQINDIGLTPSGYGLFSAAADKVRCFFQGCGSGSGSRRAKMTTKIDKSTEFSCFEVLDVLF
jgi:hypothetical protein